MVRRGVFSRWGGVVLQETWCECDAPQQARLCRDHTISEATAPERADRSREFRAWAGVLGIELDEIVDTERSVQKGCSPVS